MDIIDIQKLNKDNKKVGEVRAAQLRKELAAIEEQRNKKSYELELIQDKLEEIDRDYYRA